MNPSSPPRFPETQAASAGPAFQPEAPGRLQEIIAWASSAALIASAVFLYTRMGTLARVHIILLVLFLAGAAAVSFANWMDRHTAIIVSDKAIEYSSPLRKYRIPWNDVTIVRILPLRGGYRVFVQAREEHFTFRIPSGSIQENKASRANAFIHGDLLTGIILRNSPLQNPEWKDGFWEYHTTRDAFPNHTQP